VRNFHHLHITVQLMCWVVARSQHAFRGTASVKISRLVVMVLFSMFVVEVSGSTSGSLRLCRAGALLS